jgi:hypothetical protein
MPARSARRSSSAWRALSTGCGPCTRRAPNGHVCTWLTRSLPSSEFRVQSWSERAVPIQAARPAPAPQQQPPLPVPRRGLLLVDQRVPCLTSPCPSGTSSGQLHLPRTASQFLLLSQSGSPKGETGRGRRGGDHPRGSGPRRTAERRLSMGCRGSTCARRSPCSGHSGFPGGPSRYAPAATRRRCCPRCGGSRGVAGFSRRTVSPRT